MEILKTEAKNNTLSHAYLLIGPNKLLAEKFIAELISVKNIDQFDIEVVRPLEVQGKAGEIKIDDIRSLLRKVAVSAQNNTKLAVIYNCEKLNSSSGNALLKNLEEPSGAVIFVLIANNSSVMPTIKSRCRVINISTAEKEAPSVVFIPSLKKGFFESSKIIEEAVKNGQTDDLLSELTADQNKKLLKEKEIKFVKSLEEIELARKKISQNANPRLVLEVLISKIKGTL